LRIFSVKAICRPGFADMASNSAASRHHSACVSGRWGWLAQDASISVAEQAAISLNLIMRENLTG
jgi:hypothetical protein